ncbi:MAG: hypothetical protein JO199_06330 [Candidatus Eremiobacteraeota bacterium]|nr:hypothetical protein [Candidatus Eremiobacteraeota bacterium]
MVRWVVAVCLVEALAGCGGHAAPSIPAAAPDTSNARAIPAQYSIVDLGAGFQPARVNNSNEVVGQLKGFAAAYDSGKLTALGVHTGDQYSYASDVNDAGTIVGTSGIANNTHAAVFRIGRGPSLLVSERRFPWTYATAIDDRGEIVGNAFLARYGGESCSVGVTFQSGRVHSVVAYGYIYHISRINEHGTVLGDAEGPSPSGHPCIGTEYGAIGYADGRVEGIPMPKNAQGVSEGYGGISPNGLNDNEIAVGAYGYCKTRRSSICGRAGFFFHDGELKILYDPDMHARCVGLHAINDGNRAVGSLCAGGDRKISHAILVAPSYQIYDLNALIPPTCGWVLEDALDINNRGAVVGTGVLDGVAHGFMLIPG